MIALDAENNRLIVGDKSRLGVSSITVGAINWVSIEEPSEPLRALVKTRYAQTPVAARIEYAAFAPGNTAGTCMVILDEPLDGVAPGQACVFYDEDGCIVLGGGTIIAGISASAG